MAVDPSRPRAYKGVLRRRMPSTSSATRVEWCTALIERLHALADHYGLDPQASEFGLDLALRLAFDHVEGFQTSRGKGGRPVHPDQDARDIMLLLEVTAAKWRGKTAASAFRRMALERQKMGAPTSATALRKRYSELMRPGKLRDRFLDRPPATAAVLAKLGK